MRCSLTAPEGLADAALAFCAAAPFAATLKRASWSATASLAYVYLQLAVSQDLTAAALGPLAAQWQRLCPSAQAIDISRLQRVLDLQGASAGLAPAAHYTVETDPREGWDDEIGRWYALEHMPGLAAVPGCILAQRYTNHDSGPRSLACYDLAGADVLATPTWLAVRETEWSSRARPHFTKTRRTMMDVMA